MTKTTMTRILALAALWGIHASAAPLEPLGPNEGYALLIINGANGDRLELDGEGLFSGTNVRPDKSDGYLEIIKLKAGRYHWKKMWVGESVYGSTFYTLDDSNLDFTVKPGVISYPGHLDIRWRSGGASFRMLDRLSVALRELQQQTDPVLARYPLEYTGKGTDDFADFYRQQ